MRLASLLSIAAATTFAALTFFSPSANACNFDNPSPIPPIKDQLVIFREYSPLFTVFPHFGLLQPEGTQPVYKNDTHGRVRNVAFVNTKGVTVLKAQFEYRPVPNTPRSYSKHAPPVAPEHTQIYYAILKAYSEDGNTMIDYAYVRFIYPKGISPFYSSLLTRTPRGEASAGQPEHLIGACFLISEEEKALASGITFPGEKRERKLDADGAIVLRLPNQPQREIWLGEKWQNAKISIMPASTINNL